MSEAQEKAMITLDGVEYVVEDLPDNAKYCLQQLEDIEGQARQARVRLDQLAMSEKGFIAQLKVEVDAEEVAE
mgnify:CR=1 FL=1|jgi:hypothetical protein|tara:strand:+ start:472 stop:690 length:219 start_codon:yes stop_codon:yes gene_type:complete